MWLHPENTMHYIALNILLQLSISLKSFRNILFYSEKLNINYKNLKLTMPEARRWRGELK